MSELIWKKRSSNVKVFENADHSRTEEIYLDAVHYQDEDGSWKDMYFYVKNLQGDIIGLIDRNGNTVVEYTYVAWGNPSTPTVWKF